MEFKKNSEIPKKKKQMLKNIELISKYQDMKSEDSENLLQKEYVNLAFYKFVSIENPHELIATLKELCLALSLKGTILVSEEGINSCLVGEAHAADNFIAFMHSDARFSGIDFKKSISFKVPFKRMLVKYRKEIVTMGQPNIAPACFTGEYVTPVELMNWLDAKEEVLLVDTRNDYEYRLGSFRNAINPELKNFRSFPKWISQHLSSHKSKKIVTFCTGGIRCEKATAYMRQQGFEKVYQIQGGILKHFEQAHVLNRNSHFEGDCFVFDYRVALNQKLEPGEYKLCYACRQPLAPQDLLHPSYVEGESCRYCDSVSNSKELLA